VARLFVAADLPARVRCALSAMEVPGRRVPAESLHVTLCFLGEMDEAEIPAISSVVGAMRAGGPVRLSLGEVLWLPPRRPRVCAVGLADVDGALGALQASLAGELSAGGWYAPERRPFLAHVTVARLRGEGRRTEIAPPAVAVPALEPFTLPSVTLYRSLLGAGGARYEPLASVALAPAAGC
jgi:2'-5' RNA ligase